MRRADYLHVPIVWKSGNLHLMELSRPVDGLLYNLHVCVISTSSANLTPGANKIGRSVDAMLGLE